MQNVIDLARVRRMRFETGKTERELAVIDFDEFGNPVPLERRIHGNKEESITEEAKEAD